MIKRVNEVVTPDYDLILQTEVDFMQTVDELMYNSKQLATANLNHFNVDQITKWTEEIKELNEKIDQLVTATRQY